MVEGALLSPQEARPKRKERPRRRYERKKVHDVVSGANLIKKLEGEMPAKDNLLKIFEGEELLRVLNDLKFKDQPGSKQEKIDGFKPFEEAAESILALTNEPNAIFGSLALYKRRFRPGQEIPADIDIATTPQGAEELYDALKDREDVVITDELGEHDKGGPLAALRFAGYLLHEGQSHPFEVFGEGGTYKGEEYQGLFQLGAKELDDAQALIDGNVFTQRSLKAAYKRIKAVEVKKSGYDRKSRTAKIKALKEEVHHGEDYLKVEELKRRLESDQEDEG